MHDARTHVAAAPAARHELTSARMRRITGLRAQFDAAGIDALLVTHLPNVFYLSGFTGTTGSLLLTAERQFFLADFRYHGRLGTEVHGSWELADTTGLPLADLLSALLPPGQFLGVEAAHMTLARFAPLASGRSWTAVQTEGLVERQRMVKDELELAAIRRAAGTGAEVFAGLLPLLNAQAGEADIVAEIEYRARRLGATATSFKPIIASGARGALPHAGFTTALLEPATPVVIDMGVVVDGYCSDMTRTVFIDDCPAHWRELYATVDRARQAGQDALREGVTGAAADGAARAVIAAAGYAAQFGHGLGHGVGIEIHEDPRLVGGYGGLLHSGHVVTCEPGVYLPGQGGIRIENMCAITGSGCEQLTPLGTELVVL